MVYQRSALPYLRTDKNLIRSGTLISEFFIPWRFTVSRGDLGEFKGKAMDVIKAKVKAKIKVKKIKFTDLFETKEF